jgi:hypothetical protein
MWSPESSFNQCSLILDQGTTPEPAKNPPLSCFCIRKRIYSCRNRSPSKPGSNQPQAPTAIPHPLPGTQVHPIARSKLPCRPNVKTFAFANQAKVLSLEFSMNRFEKAPFSASSSVT